MSYLHIGKNVMVSRRRIIGVFDLDITSQSPRTESFWTGRRGTAWCWTPATISLSHFWCATTLTISSWSISPS